MDGRTATRARKQRVTQGEGGTVGHRAGHSALVPAGPVKSCGPALGAQRACSEQRPPQKQKRESSSCRGIGAPSCHRRLAGKGGSGRPVGMVKGQRARALDRERQRERHVTGESRRLLWDDTGPHNPAILSARHRSPCSGDSGQTNPPARAQVRKPMVGRRGQRPRRQGPGPG